MQFPAQPLADAVVARPGQRVLERREQVPEDRRLRRRQDGLRDKEAAGVPLLQVPVQDPDQGLSIGCVGPRIRAQVSRPQGLQKT